MTSCLTLLVTIRLRRLGGVGWGGGRGTQSHNEGDSHLPSSPGPWTTHRHLLCPNPTAVSLQEEQGGQSREGREGVCLGGVTRPSRSPGDGVRGPAEAGASFHYCSLFTVNGVRSIPFTALASYLASPNLSLLICKMGK